MCIFGQLEQRNGMCNAINPTVMQYLDWTQIN